MKGVYTYVIQTLRGRSARFAALCLLLAALVGVGVFYIVAPTSGTSFGQYPEVKELAAKNTWTFDELSEYFTTLANKKGAVYSYAVLKVAPLPPGIDLHLMGHAVGEVLYTQEGIEGIKECTQDFRNACSHTIVIGALQQFGAGDATIQKIQDACLLAPGGPGAYTMCYHGLGHGVFAYHGYKIPETVAFCKRLGTPEYHNQEYPQCVGGMVMELIDGGGHDIELWEIARDTYLDESDPLAPCSTSLIPEETKYFCYTYLTPHLFVAAGTNLGSPDPATFAKAFSFCTPISDARMRGVCYAGFGKEFVPLAAARDIRSIDKLSDETYQKAISWCLLAPNEEAKEACIEQALASVFWGGESDPSASFRFCSLVNDAAAGRSCYEDLSRNINQYIRGSERARLCNELPADLRQACIESRRT